MALVYEFLMINKLIEILIIDVSNEMSSYSHKMLNIKYLYSFIYCQK